MDWGDSESYAVQWLVIASAGLAFVKHANLDGYVVTAYGQAIGGAIVVIPSRYDDGTNGELPVVEIGEYAFFAGTDSESGNLIPNIITSVTIPNTIKMIGYDAFAYAKNLSSLIFTEGSTLETIRDTAFLDSTLESIEIPASVNVLGMECFSSAETVSILRSVTFQEGSQLETIESYVFKNTQIETIIIPEGVKSIGHYAFAYAESLTEVTIPASVINMGQNVFEEYDGTATRTIRVLGKTSLVDAQEKATVAGGSWETGWDANSGTGSQTVVWDSE